MAANKETVTIRRPSIKRVKIRIIGDSPLITHAWDEKAKRMMLEKQQKKSGTKTERQERLPFDDFAKALYWITPMPTQTYKDKVNGKDREIVTEELFEKALKEGAKFGFPANSFKMAANSAAYRMGWVKDKMALRGTYFLKAEDGNELAEIKGCIPMLREDMVGVQMSTDLRYRPIFENWYVDMILEYNENGTLSLDEILSCIEAGGYSVGVGEWRPECDGIFGRFHVKTD